MVAFRFGPFSIAWYGIMITTGVIACTLLSYREAKRRGLDPEHVLKLVLIVLPLGMIGARLYHVFDPNYFQYYLHNPRYIFGGAGLGIFGALAGGALGLIVYTRWQKLSTIQWMDILAPGIILAQAIGRWGNFFNQELYGRPTTSTTFPLAIYIDQIHRLPGFENFSYFQPLFFYEFSWDLLGAIFLIVVGWKLQKRLLTGDLFCLYVVWYSIGRFYLEGLKTDIWIAGGVPMARWITGIAFVVSIAIMVYRHSRRGRTTSTEQPVNP